MRANIFIKVEIEYDAKEPPEKLAEQICRQIQKVYGVRQAEVSHVTPEE
jgi:hypothetical protein